MFSPKYPVLYKLLLLITKTPKFVLLTYYNQMFILKWKMVINIICQIQ